MATSKKSHDASASTSLSSAHDLHDCFPEPPCWKYDVFLSFQGEGPSGTRNNFTDVLYTALCRKGIVTFKDDKELGKGRVIGDDLMMAIENSALFLVVLSMDYASSKWCLHELAKIMECSKNRKRTSSPSLSEAFILPVFHDVDPKDVRKQKGSFEESFLKHEQENVADKEMVCKWKSAMTDVGNLSGWVTRGKKWTEVADEIATLIFNRTNHYWSSLSTDLVGLDSRVQDVMAHLSMDSVCFFGICGMGGIGKTTLADLVHRRIRHCFEASIFLRNIRETSSRVNGLVSLQKRLISRIFKVKGISLDNESDGVELLQKRLPQKKVLIILDDVDDSKQLAALALSSDCFRKGSKVIITTRNERLLSMHGAITYKLEGLNNVDALKLFCWKAFRSDSPPEGYVELSHYFLNRANGLPLALEVLGSSLYKRSILEWQSNQSMLAEVPIEEVSSTLGISLHGLDEIAKEVFLHIACVFEGWDEHRVLHILSCYYGFSLNHVISILKERSLVKNLHGGLYMHNLIKQMGVEVAFRESPDDCGKRNLLWRWKDIYSVLETNTGTAFIKGVVLTYPVAMNRPLSAKGFSQMTKLRLLIISHDVPFGNNLTYLSNDLRLLEWTGFPSKFLPTSFEAKDLVELSLPNGHLRELWRGIKHFTHLKTINLSHSKSLTKTPDFTGTPHLEKIILEGCLRLCEVHKSIGILKKLTLLNLKDCKRLKVLPDNICNLKSLSSLDLSGCSSLTAFPPNLNSLKCLEELKVVGKAMKKSSTPWLSCFCFLAPASSRSSRGSFVPPLSSLTLMTQLELSFCNLSNGTILDGICCLHGLEILNLSGNIFSELPSCFTQLTKLRRVELNHCESLRYLPTLPSRIERVFCEDCPSLELLPDQLTVHASEGSSLSFLNCRNLRSSYRSSDLANMLLENYLGSLKRNATHDHEFKFRIIIPGNSVPRWISNLGRGNFVHIDLPDFGLRDTWSGFVVCCVFALCRRRHPPDHIYGRRCYPPYYIYEECEITCYLGGDEGRPLGCSFSAKLGKNRMRSMSNHILLFHVFRENSFLPLLESKQATFTFGGCSCLVIKSCGGVLVSEQQTEPMGSRQIIELD